MVYSKILGRLYVGSCPQSDGDVRELKTAGITALMNLQTDDDFIRWSIKWPPVQEACLKEGIKTVRYPIFDFDTVDLRLRLGGAVKLLGELIKEHTVYLHCTAGVNRSPTVAIAYIMHTQNKDHKTALREFKELHNSEPYASALRGWEEDRKGESYDLF